MTAKYCERAGCLQRDSVERKAYAGAPSAGNREGRERDGADDLLERILERDNLNRAYKQVKRNHGAPGIDGMTVADARPWLRYCTFHHKRKARTGWVLRFPSPVRATS